jgi:hypothetical protein
MMYTINCEQQPHFTQTRGMVSETTLYNSCICLITESFSSSHLSHLFGICAKHVYHLCICVPVASVSPPLHLCNLHISFSFAFVVALHLSRLASAPGVSNLCICLVVACICLTSGTIISFNRLTFAPVLSLSLGRMDL